jgi:hypothetical protein
MLRQHCELFQLDDRNPLALEPTDVVGDVHVPQQRLAATHQESIAGAIVRFVQATLEVVCQRRLTRLDEQLHHQRMITRVAGDDPGSLAKIAHTSSIAVAAGRKGGGGNDARLRIPAHELRITHLGVA